jgi:hypothetical protein
MLYGLYAIRVPIMCCICAFCSVWRSLVPPALEVTKGVDLCVWLSSSFPRAGSSFHWMFFIHCLATPTFNSRAINNKLLIGEVEPMGDFVLIVMCPACPAVV